MTPVATDSTGSTGRGEFSGPGAASGPCDDATPDAIEGGLGVETDGP